MKKWKDISRNERRMLAAILILAIAVLLRWTAVKEGISQGFNVFHRDMPTENQK